MESINSRPRPRLLVVDGSSVRPDYRSLFAEFPTIEVVNGISDLDAVDQTEYDIAVVVRCHFDMKMMHELSRHLLVLHVGDHGLLLSDTDEDHLVSRLEIGVAVSVAKEFAIPSQLQSDLRERITTNLLPIYEREAAHLTLVSSIWYGSHLRSRNNLWVPILSDLKGNILAGYYEIDRGGERWWLPSGLDYGDIKDWLSFLCKRWSLSHPSYFSAVKQQDWRESAEWMTSGEIHIKDHLSKMSVDLEEYIARHAIEVQEKQNELQLAKAEADGGIRRLITAQGDELKDTVKSQLEYLGFEVEDVDETIAQRGDLLEDLRIGFGDKIPEILVEVRGYKGGAKLSDLIRIINRFEKRYIKANEGREPRALWYIVNHDFGTEPGSRDMALSSHQDEVEEFGKANGLVIDTVELFKFTQMVDVGTLTREEARQRLLAAKGFFYAEAKEKPSSGKDLQG